MRVTDTLFSDRWLLIWVGRHFPLYRLPIQGPIDAQSQLKSNMHHAVRGAPPATPSANILPRVGPLY